MKIYQSILYLKLQLAYHPLHLLSQDGGHDELVRESGGSCGRHRGMVVDGGRHGLVIGAQLGAQLVGGLLDLGDGQLLIVSMLLLLLLIQVDLVADELVIREALE